ncbi:MAG: shikimate dehydrogenase [Myxococcales bacterium]|nr:shikimate dehydrogenase [Myxococcales bacterium]
MLHRAAGQSCGVEVDYGLFDVPPSAVEARLAALREAGLAGVNVTAPHKLAAARFAEVLTPAARAVGVCNTLVFGEAVVGDNTDVEGFARALGPLPGPRAVVFGAGGAARAVVRALLDDGIEQVVVANRSVARAESLRDAFADRRIAVAPGDPRAALDGADLLVDCLPAPAALTALPFGRLAADARIVTLRYGSTAEPLRRAVGDRRPFDDGLAMLGWQGIAAFTRWTGRIPAPEAVLAALRVAAAGPH